ncbi:DUF7010 family protein [Mesonia maritima]|uniref:Uncharacterized protein n=1 Tax=Mesonia maritima TaxID=1793873 RepID=A0ABU1K6T6_9FLAO|nr:hypothetical protein [Mesonia maritima]MDR6300985.1 hypothetical protein [Mesonia maritima]
MEKNNLKKLKLEIQVEAKKGIDFIISGGILWLAISFIWLQEFSSYNKSIITFMVAALMLPLAFALSKLFSTNWKIKNNSLQPLGLWLNFAQLIYFPILVFVLLEQPDNFIMAYAIITGAHLFPYAWLYEDIGYAITAIIISIGSLGIGLYFSPENFWIIPLFTSSLLFLLSLKILFLKRTSHLKN